MNPISPLIERHYHAVNLYETVLAALEKKGITSDTLSWQDLSAVDEFHVRGLEATIELAQEANLRSGTQVLDVGCGIGGAARLLAAQYDCKVTGIDLVQEYIRTAQLLTEKVGLSDYNTFIQADALELPFSDGQFEVVWTQHVQMNIEDKATFYQELARMLQPDGRLMYYDVFATTGESLYLPVPWADSVQTSFLITIAVLEKLLQLADFEQIITFDVTEKSIQWFRKLLERIAEKGVPPLSLQLLMGDSFIKKLENMLLNLQEGKIMLQSGIYQKAK